MESFNPLFVTSYDPLKAGSIDGTDDTPHDRAIVRALNSKFRPNKNVPGDPECTIFIGRLNPNTTEQTIHQTFREFGSVQQVKIIRDLVTGYSKCYAFVEFEDCYQARSAIRSGHKMVLDDHEILVDSEKERLLKGWIPRRLGGGLGGKRESGQLRFGGRDRPFSKPILCQDETARRNSSKDSGSSSRHGRDYSERHQSHRRNRSRSRSRERGCYTGSSRSRNRY